MNDRLTIFHGSDKIIEKPYFHGSKKNNDYGYGFYCTENEEVAKEWSVDYLRSGFCNRYSLNIKDLAILNLNNGQYSVLDWLAILLENREFEARSPLAKEGKRYILENFNTPYKEADIVIGYRADDSYFSFASDFINGTISLRQLSKAMHLGKLGEQIVLISKKSYNRISFESYENTDWREWYPKKEKRDQNARKEYYDLDKNSYIKGDLYMPMIIDREVKQNDPSLF